METLQEHFKKFREGIIGNQQTFITPYGEKSIVYADWTASGRLYSPIENKLSNSIGAFVANTHTETSTTGATMTLAYHKARTIIKNHVNASQDDVLIMAGTGMTGAINKFQRILGLKVSENLKDFTNIPEDKRPIVFVSHMEHHSNQTSWYETIADVEVIPCNKDGLVCLNEFEKAIKKHKNRAIKIVSIVATSNVTGIHTPYHKVASLIHKYNGLCFVDFACCAPYIDINMHPENEDEHLDAIFFSPHKFLGGPGTSGVLIFNKNLYHNTIPDNPGGGTVTYTNPWGGHFYFNDIETREDGGTPGFLQTIKTALAIQVKDEMDTQKIHDREQEINKKMFDCLFSLENVNVFASNVQDRLSIFSFVFEGYHFNLVVKLLNDRYGIQTRGGCSCAGTYGHYLFNVDKEKSKEILDNMTEGCSIDKPGWVRLSLHPTTTDQEVEYICNALKELHDNIEEWSKEYEYNLAKNDYTHIHFSSPETALVDQWFSSSIT